MLAGAVTVLVSAGYGLVVDPPGVAPLLLQLCLLCATFGAAPAAVAVLGTTGRLRSVDSTRAVVVALAFVAGSVLLVNLPAPSRELLRAAPTLAAAVVSLAGALTLGTVVSSATVT